MQRQVVQSIGQFLIIVASGLLIYEHPPHGLHEFYDWVWQPALQAILAVGGIWGISRTGKGGQR